MKKLIIMIVINISLSALAITGYVKNIIKLCHCDFKPSYKAEIIYGIGATSGLGAITGYLDFGK